MGNILGMFFGAWFRPWGTMEAVKNEGYTESAGSGFSNFVANTKKYMMFVIVMGLVSGIITSLVGTFLPPAGAAGNRAFVWLAVAVVPAVSFLGSFLGALIIWALVDGLLSGKSSGYGLSYKLIAILAAFSPISAALAPIPKVGQILAIVLNVWATIVMIVGIIIVRKTSTVRTVVVCGFLFAFLFLLGVFARVAAQRQFAGGPGLPDFGTEAGAGAGADNLDQQLEDLANQSQGGQAPAGNTAPAQQQPAPAAPAKK